MRRYRSGDPVHRYFEPLGTLGPTFTALYNYTSSIKNTVHTQQTQSKPGHFRYHFPLFFTAGPAHRGVAAGAFAFGAVLALDPGAFVPTLAGGALGVGAGAIRLACGVPGLLIGLGVGLGCVLLPMPRGC